MQRTLLAISLVALPALARTFEQNLKEVNDPFSKSNSF
jgi:hypothetical protein